MAITLTAWGLMGDQNPKTIKKLLFWEPFLFPIQSGIPTAQAVILTGTLQGCEHHLCEEHAFLHPKAMLINAEKNSIKGTCKEITFHVGAAQQPLALSEKQERKQCCTWVT